MRRADSLRGVGLQLKAQMQRENVFNYAVFFRTYTGNDGTYCRVARNLGPLVDVYTITIYCPTTICSEENILNHSEVIGFEGEDENSGDIICLYFKKGKVKASRLYINKSASSVKVTETVLGKTITMVPETLEPKRYMRTFSKRFKIKHEYYYLFASPSTKESFVEFSILGRPAFTDGYQNKKYYSIYNPRNGKMYQIPVESFGIFSMLSCFNISSDTFYTCKVVTHPVAVQAIECIVFTSIKFTINKSGDFEFEDSVEKRIYANDLINTFGSGKVIENIAIDFVSEDGVFSMPVYRYENSSYVSCYQCLNGVLTFDMKSGRLGGQLVYDSSGVLQICTDIVGDKIIYHNATLNSYGVDREVFYDETKINFSSDVSYGGNPALWSHTRMYAERLKLPMGYSNDVQVTNIYRKCFYQYYMTSWYEYEGYPGSAFGYHLSERKVVTPYEILETPKTNEAYDALGMSYIERYNKDIFQAIAIVEGPGGAEFEKSAVTDIICYYNGVRIDEKIAAALKIEKTSMFGFIHRPKV